jgi:anion-transporting  ArsA/GET3 family ATPase
MTTIDNIVEHKEVIVCAGSGGVGKTTTAAAIALHAALMGKKVAVVTIDPARRLASALGMKKLTNEPKKVSAEKFAAANLGIRGELHAMMLDTKSTFDHVVITYAPSTQKAQQILDNRFYRNISGTLSGTHEYMAMEKLYELHSEKKYDLIVIDTPPTRNALDFLDAPKRMIDFLDSKVLRWFLLPYMKAGGGLFRIANAAATTFLRVVKKIVGAEVLQDTAEFFGSLEGMYDGFKQRAQDVTTLLHSSVTSFVVVTSPATESIAEACYFATRLEESGLPFGAVVVNRVHPQYSDGVEARPRQIAKLQAGNDNSRLLAKLIQNEQSFRKIVRSEEQNLVELAQRIPRHRWLRVPYLDKEAVDLPGVAAIASQLFSN